MKSRKKFQGTWRRVVIKMLIENKKCDICGHTSKWHNKYGVTCGKIGDKVFINKTKVPSTNKLRKEINKAHYIAYQKDYDNRAFFGDKEWVNRKCKEIRDETLDQVINAIKGVKFKC
jgi:hypothetical protein